MLHSPFSFAVDPFTGPFSISRNALDVDAQGYITKLATGRAITTNEQNATNTYIYGLKTDGAYTGLIDAMFLMWGNATSNSKSIKTSSNGAFAGGSVVHNTRSTSFSSSGYLLTPYTPSTISWTYPGIFFSLATGVGANAGGFDFGAQGPSGANNLYLAVASTALGGHITDLGGGGVARVTLATTGATAAIYMALRVSNTTGYILKCDAGGVTTLATNAAMNGGIVSDITAGLTLGALNSNGSVGNFLARTYRSCGVVSMTLAQAQAFLLRTWAYEQALIAI